MEGAAVARDIVVIRGNAKSQQLSPKCEAALVYAMSVHGGQLF